MRKLLLLVSFIFVSLNVLAQSDQGFYNAYSQRPPVFMGFATGLNNFTGLFGVSAELGLDDRFSGYMGLGMGSWGYKASVGAKYYFWAYPEGWALNIGLSRSSGIASLDVEVNTVPYPMRLKPSNTMNISMVKHWPVGYTGRSRFHVEFGYGLKLSHRPYEVLDSSKSMTQELHYLMDILQPGGLMLGIGFSFAIN